MFCKNLPMFKLMVGKQKKNWNYIKSWDESLWKKYKRGGQKWPLWQILLQKKKKRNNLQKQSFFLKRNNLTSHNHWTNKCTITFNQRETKVQSMRNRQPFHTPNVWTFSNEVTLRKKSKFSLEYREESSNPETNSDG